MDNQSPSSDKSPPILEQRVLWGFAKYIQTDKGYAFRPAWKRILTVSAFVFLSLWLLKSAAIFCFFRYSRGFEEITVLDSALFPTNRRKLSTKFGEKQIAEAKQALESGEIQKAVFLFRTGLSRSPSNRDARIRLANLIRLAGSDEVALELFKGGLEYHSGDPFYMRACMQIFLDNRMDKEVRDYAEKRLGSLTSSPTDADKIVAYAFASMEELNGRFEESVALIHRYGLEKLPEGCVLLAKNNWHCGNRDAAIDLLKRYIQDHPRIIAESVYLALCSYLVEENRGREASLYSMNYASATPQSAPARRLFITSLLREGNHKRAEVEMTRYLNDFSGALDALTQPFDNWQDIADPQFARDVYGLAMEKKGNPATFNVLLCKALLAAREFDEVIRICDLVEGDQPAWLNRFQENFDYIRTIAAAGKGQNSVARIHLDALLNSDKLTPQSMLSMARDMRREGLDDYALTLLKHARSLDARNEEILGEMIGIQMDRRMDDNFTANVGDMLTLRTPDYFTLTKIRSRLASDHFILDERRDAVLKTLDDTIGRMDTARASLSKLR